MTPADVVALARFRERLHDAVNRSLALDGHCKSYEGAIEICTPSVFDDEWIVKVHCYVLGPHRHYSFTGNRFEIALNKADEELTSWIVELEDDERENG
jgi:hypothetical protein